MGDSGRRADAWSTPTDRPAEGNAKSRAFFFGSPQKRVAGVDSDARRRAEAPRSVRRRLIVDDCWLATSRFKSLDQSPIARARRFVRMNRLGRKTASHSPDCSRPGRHWKPQSRQASSGRRSHYPQRIRSRRLLGHRGLRVPAVSLHAHRLIAGIQRRSKRTSTAPWPRMVSYSQSPFCCMRRRMRGAAERGTSKRESASRVNRMVPTSSLPSNDQIATATLNPCLPHVSAACSHSTGIGPSTEDSSCPTFVLPRFANAGGPSPVGFGKGAQPSKTADTSLRLSVSTRSCFRIMNRDSVSSNYRRRVASTYRLQAAPFRSPAAAFTRAAFRRGGSIRVESKRQDKCADQARKE